MAHFYGTEAASRSAWLSRYDAVTDLGTKEWRDQGAPSSWQRGGPFASLPRFTERPAWQIGETPRIFISHRQTDEDRAEQAANIAIEEGFEVWLDIWDPELAWLNEGEHQAGVAQAVAIASTIEMALLNCSHLCAVWTALTKGSTWVPYEYGRVKDDWVVSDVVCCWTTESDKDLPSYMHLGAVERGEQRLRGWLATARMAWQLARRAPAE